MSTPLELDPPPRVVENFARPAPGTLPWVLDGRVLEPTPLAHGSGTTSYMPPLLRKPAKPRPEPRAERSEASFRRFIPWRGPAELRRPASGG